MSYENYAGSAALFTAVDVGDAADALTTLFADADLRARMGEAGRRRAAQVFDWRVVIPQYQALWAELRRRRLAAPVQAPLENPYRLDPFRMFAGYPTGALAGSDILEPGRAFAPGELTALMGRPAVRNPAARLPDDAEAEALIAHLMISPLSVAEILEGTPLERRPFVERGLTWMLKFGFLRLCDMAPRN